MDDQSNAPAFAWGDVDTEDDNSPRPCRGPTPAPAQNYSGEAYYGGITPSGAGPGSGYDQALTPQPQGWRRGCESYHEMMALLPGSEDGRLVVLVVERQRLPAVSGARSQADALAFAIPNTPGPQSQRSQNSTPRGYTIEGTPVPIPHEQAPSVPSQWHHQGQWNPDSIWDGSSGVRLAQIKGHNFDDEPDGCVGGRDDEYYRGNVEQSGKASQNAPHPSGASPLYLGWI